MALKIHGGGDAAAVKPSSGGGGSIVTVKDRYEIHVDKPLPELDFQPAVAYHATAKRDKRRPIYALICDPKMPPRVDSISSSHRVDHPNLQKAIDWSVVDWPPEGRRCPVIVLERPAGKKLFASLEDEREPVPEEKVTREFIQPMTSMLQELHGVGILHRGIRPDIVYQSDIPDIGYILGECFSSPVAVVQPLAFLTIRDGLAVAAGRGEGFPTNDLYALGVTVLALLSGKIPCRGSTDEEIMRQKLTLGSYGALSQNIRVSLTMMEPLRGLLNDDDAERWTLEDLALWIGGRRLSPKQQSMPGKASRAFRFCEEDFLTARELARAMSRNWAQAPAAIKDGGLDGWLRRSLSEEARVESVNQAKLALTDGSNNEDRLIARVIIALDPQAPIRYKSFSSTIVGMSTFLALHYHDSEARQLFAQVLNAGLVQFWCEQQSKTPVELMHFVTVLERMRATLARPGLGQGIERVMYELNPQMPCMSPLFERDYVATIEHYLPAMERLAIEQGDEINRIVDRDVAAFISTRYKRGIGNELRDIEDGDPSLVAVAQIRVLAGLQESLARKANYPALTALAVRFLQPAIDRFHSRKNRKRVMEQLKTTARQGRLEQLLALVDNQRELDMDKNGFRRATESYARSIRDTINLKRDMKNQNKIAADLGGLISTGISGMVAAISCIIYIAISMV